MIVEINDDKRQMHLDVLLKLRQVKNNVLQLVVQPMDASVLPKMKQIETNVLQLLMKPMQ